MSSETGNEIESNFQLATAFPGGGCILVPVERPHTTNTINPIRSLRQSKTTKALRSCFILSILLILSASASAQTQTTTITNGPRKEKAEG